jgi:uncharacterized BrkB/YihY/UPF0761 family membrane protein
MATGQTARSQAYQRLAAARASLRRVVDRPPGHEIEGGRCRPIVEALARFGAETLFFWWKMHFLLGGRVRWRVLFRPALVTAVPWLGLAVFSSLFFSNSVISDSREYGTIGVVFTLLSWLVLIGTVVVLGAAGGTVWQERAVREAQRDLKRCCGG